MKTTRYILKKVHVFLFLFFILMPEVCTAEISLKAKEKRDITILFEDNLADTADKLFQIYPKIRAEVEKIFEWKLKGRPRIVLFRDKKNFQKTVQNPLVAAVAIPQKNIIIIDYSSVKTDPFHFENTLKHELCHLIIHQNVEVFMPRWFEEGICQWASDGIGELIMEQKKSTLHRAYMSDSLLTLKSIEQGFPLEKRSFILAYEEGKSVVEYIISRFGKNGLLLVLAYMKGGLSVEDAFERSLSLSIYQVENQWKESISERMSWFTYLSYHIYEILFAFMAILAVIGFIRVMLKKRAYKDEAQMTE